MGLVTSNNKLISSYMFTTSTAHGLGRLRLTLNLPLDPITSGWEGNEPLPNNHPRLSTKQINRFGSCIHWILSWQVGRRGRSRSPGLPLPDLNINGQISDIINTIFFIHKKRYLLMYQKNRRQSPST